MDDNLVIAMSPLRGVIFTMQGIFLLQYQRSDGHIFNKRFHRTQPQLLQRDMLLLLKFWNKIFLEDKKNKTNLILVLQEYISFKPKAVA